MAVNIKKNFAPIIVNQEGGVVNVNTADAVERYQQYLEATDVERDERPRKRKAEAIIVEGTFRYRWAESDGAVMRIIRLYQTLIRAKWIDQNTPPEYFEALFSGDENNVKIKWTGKKAYLAYLFKTIYERDYVILPEGLENKIWVIVQSHFVDSNSRIFVNLNKEKKPKLRAGAIEKVAEILNPVSELINVDIEEDE